MKKVAELREQIAQDSRKIKNKAVLAKMAEVVNIFQRAFDDEAYSTLTEVEIEKYVAINSILRMNNLNHLKSIYVIARKLA